MSKRITIIGCPVDCGKSQQGCIMGPDALRCAEIGQSLKSLGHEVTDIGNVVTERSQPDTSTKERNRIALSAEWIRILQETAYQHGNEGEVPIFLGGDHLMSAGTVSGISRRSKEAGRAQFVLWLDAHTDFHTIETTRSGNLHGTPVAYFTGQKGFGSDFPPVPAPVPPENICMIGVRSVDAGELRSLQYYPIDVQDMKVIDETSIATPLRAFLSRVRAANGNLHVSLDVDFLDPSIAPAVGTTVPGGATFREAHLVMEILHEHDLVTSIDVSELNPFLDERGKTANLMVDLIASLMGRKVFDRPTRNQ